MKYLEIVLSFAANSLNNNDKDLILDDDYSFDNNFLSGHNEIKNSDTHIQNQNNQNLANNESRKASKTVTSLKTNRNTPYLPTSKAK